MVRTHSKKGTMVVEIKPPRKAGKFFGLFGPSERPKSGLTTVKNTLEKKAKELAERESRVKSLESLEKHEEHLTGKIEEKQSILGAVQKDIKIQIAKFKSNEREFQKRLTELEHLEKDLSEKEKILSTKEHVLEQKELSLVKTESVQKKERAMLEEKGVLLARREHQLTAEEPRLQKRIAELVQIREQVEREMNEKQAAGAQALKALERESKKAQAQFEQELNEKRGVLASVQKEFEQKTKRIEEIKKAEVEFGKLVRRQEAMAKELDRKSKMVAEHERAVSGREREFLSRERALMQRLNNLKLEQQKLEDTIVKREVTFKTLQKEIRGKKDWLSALPEAEHRVKELKQEEIEFQKALGERAEIIRQTQNTLKGLETARTKTEHDLTSLQNKIQQLTPLRAEIEKEIEGKTSQLSSFQKELKKIEQRLEEFEKIKETLDAQRAQLDERGKALAQFDRELKMREIGAAKKEHDVIQREQQLSALAPLQERIAKDMMEKKRLAQEVKDMLQENNKKLEGVHATEASLRKLQTDLARRQREFAGRTREVQLKEKEFVRREIEWLETEKRIREARDELVKQKTDLEEEIKFKTQELSRLKSEWDGMIGALKSAKEDIHKEKMDVRKLVETDLKSLAEKEDETVQLVRELEKDSIRLEENQKAIVGKVRIMEKSKKAYETALTKLREKEKQVMHQEALAKKMLAYTEREKTIVDAQRAKIKESKELRTDVKTLDARYRELLGLTQKAERKAMMYGVRVKEQETVSKKEKLLERREKQLQEQAWKLSLREQTLESKREEVVKEYLQEAVEKTFAAAPLIGERYPKIHQMIDSARKNLEHGDIDTAARIVVELELLAEQIKNPEEKRLVSYDIKDLKTSIKLASLA